MAAWQVLARGLGAADHLGDGLSVSPGGQGTDLVEHNHGISRSLSAQDNRLFVRCCLPPLSATPNPEPPCGSRIRRDPRLGFEGTSATQAYQLRVLHSGD